LEDSLHIDHMKLEFGALFMLGHVTHNM